MIFTYMCSEQLWDKQYQLTNQYLDRFSRNLYFVALGVGVSVCGNFTIFTYTNGRIDMAEKVHRIIHNNRNTNGTSKCTNCNNA